MCRLILSINHFSRKSIISKKFITALIFLEYYFIAVLYSRAMRNKDIRLLMPDDPGFPHLLNQLKGILRPHEMPKRLFIEGTLPPCDQISVAGNNRATEMKYLCVVGARKHSSYGREACEKLIAGLAGYNICIVSGLALGIDSIAHEAALDAGLPTIAFPGSGLDRDVIYPARSQRLARRIVEAGTSGVSTDGKARFGALLSEFDMDFYATDWSFPQRNRLMAGVSHATLVIEAKLKSGTLITAGMAHDYNRDVFAVPGPIFSALSEGPNKLISEGAAIVRSSEDIIRALGMEPKREDRKVETKSLTDEEQKILDILIEPMEKDLLIREINSLLAKSVPEINALLSMMEISGMIVEEKGMVRTC